MPSNKIFSERKRKPTSKRKNVSNNERVRELRERLENGSVRDYEDAAQQLNISANYVFELMDQIGAKFMRKSWHSVNEINQAIKDGAETLNEISDRCGLTYRYVSQLLIQEGIKVKRKEVERKKPGWHETADDLIRKGFSLEEIGNEIGLTRQGVGQYLHRSGQHEKWQKARQRRKANSPAQLEKTRKGVLGGLVSIAIQNAYENADDSNPRGWAQRKAAEYKLSTKLRTTYSFETLTEVFRRYKEALNRGEKLSLEKLAEGAGMLSSKVGRVLKRVGLEPMHGAKEKGSSISEEQIRLIEKAAKTCLPVKDVAYFLGIPARVVQWNISKHKIKRPIKPDICAKSFGRGKKLSYRLASQIYEAEDAEYFDEFSREEVAELLDTNTKVIDYALEKRGQISPVINYVLDVINPDREIERPY